MDFRSWVCLAALPHLVSEFMFQESNLEITKKLLLANVDVLVSNQTTANT